MHIYRASTPCIVLGVGDWHLRSRETKLSSALEIGMLRKKCLRVSMRHFPMHLAWRLNPAILACVTFARFFENIWLVTRTAPPFATNHSVTIHDVIV
jgi:hypothetical protein